jgi:hypothetical protein
VNVRNANRYSSSSEVSYCTEVNKSKQNCISLSISLGHWHVPVIQPVSLLRGETKKCAGPSQLGDVYSGKCQEKGGGGGMSEGRELQDLYNYRNNSNLQHVTFLCSISRFLFS